MSFSCFDCKSIIKKKFIDGIYKIPKKCINNKCKNTKTFLPDKNNCKTILY